MFSHFNFLTKPGLSNNEDAIFHNANLMIVMDAATDLSKTHLTAEPTDGCWLSKNTVEKLSKLLSGVSAPIGNVLDAVTKELKQELDYLGYDKIENAYPSASIMIARVIEDTLELFSIGDCTTLIEFADGSIKQIHDEAVTKLDGSVLDELKSLRKQTNKSIIDLLPQIQHLLLQNRQKRNTSDGYWIFDPTGIAIPHADIFTFKCSEIKSIALMSDGFYALTELAEYSSDADIVHALKTTSADVLINTLYDELAADGEYNKYPRFKMRDDASVIYAEITN